MRHVDTTLIEEETGSISKQPRISRLQARPQRLGRMVAWPIHRTHHLGERRHLLEGSLCHPENVVIWVANAHHVKHVPGRKTDVADSEYLAQLVLYGLVRGRFQKEAALQASGLE